jgi:cytochrome c2
MDSFEVNKILGALLGTCLVLLAVHIAAGAVFAPEKPAKPGYVVAMTEEQPAAASGKTPAEAPIETLLASASVAHGQQIAKECELCHNLGKGQGTKIGPDLYGVVGRKVASEAGFNYTAALKDSSVAKSGNGTWTFDKLNKWLTDPRADVAGTAMTFAGLSSEKQRADVIAFLNSNSDKPLPLPKVAQTPPPTKTATAANEPVKPAAAAPAKASFESLVATASIPRGKQIVKECELCHNLVQGQGPKIGPDLYGVVGRKVASQPGFNYTAALKAKGGTWTLDALNKWLTDPRADVPGTAMTFAGLSSEKERADVVAYLNSNSAKPLPLQKAGGSEPAQAAKPAQPVQPAQSSGGPAAPAPAPK